MKILIETYHQLLKDLDPDTLNFETLEKIKSLDVSKLPKLESNLRIGACVIKSIKVHWNWFKL